MSITIQKKKTLPALSSTAAVKVNSFASLYFNYIPATAFISSIIRRAKSSANFWVAASV